MVSAQKREKLSTLLHSLETEDRKWLQQKLMRQDTASLLRDEKGLSDQELLAAESWYWQQYAESTSMRARRAHARLWCIFMLLRYGGLRLVEALALELGHMDWGAGIIHIQGEHARQVPLPATHCRRLRQMMEDPALFTPSGALLHCDASYVRRSLQQCGNACGLPAGLLSARSLRQTRILELVRQGLPAPVAAWLEQMKAAGIKLMIVSNNTRKRVSPFAASLGLPFVSLACKPLPWGIRKAARQLGVSRREFALVGDQLFTDRLAGWLYGIRVLVVQPIQVLGYGLFTPASVYFVNESVPQADRVKGQTVMMVASNGLGGMMGGVLAGWTLDLGGANLMLCACIASGCLGALLCLAALGRGRSTPSG